MRLAGKTIIVTGAASGIGHACASMWAFEGARVVLADVNRDAVNDLAKSLGKDALAIDIDVGSPAGWTKLVETTLKHWSRLDGLANIAGIGGVDDTIESCPVDLWQNVMRVNLDAVFLGTKFAVLAMKGSGGGSIINMSSIYGKVADPRGTCAAYSTSKGGVTMLTKAAAVHCAEQNYNIRINSLHPGFIDTPMVYDVFAQEADAEAERKRTIERHPMGRLGHAEEIAKVGTYLLSDESAFVSGSEFVIDGGYTAV